MYGIPNPQLGPMPQGWECKYDYTTNRYFYINHVAKITSWEDPRLSQQRTVAPPPPQQRIVQSSPVDDRRLSAMSSNSSLSSNENQNIVADENVIRRLQESFRNFSKEKRPIIVEAVKIAENDYDMAHDFLSEIFADEQPRAVSMANENKIKPPATATAAAIRLQKKNSVILTEQDKTQILQKLNIRFEDEIDPGKIKDIAHKHNFDFEVCSAKLAELKHQSSESLTLTKIQRSTDNLNKSKSSLDENLPSTSFFDERKPSVERSPSPKKKPMPPTINRSPKRAPHPPPVFQSSSLAKGSQSNLAQGPNPSLRKGRTIAVSGPNAALVSGPNASLVVGPNPEYMRRAIPAI